MHALEETIQKAKKQARLALIPFITAGFPKPELFWKMMHELDDNGADIIEIGVPFSDPVADGPVVEEASLRSLDYGVTLSGILEDLKKNKGKIKAKLVLMGYLNPFYQYGFEELAKDAQEAGVQGIIIPDLPFEEANKIRNILKSKDIALIALVGPNTSEERMQQYAKVSEGYVYVVSIMGTTGARQTLSEQVEPTLLRARSCFSLPLALGFGLQNPEQLSHFSEKAKPDAAVFGSALLKHIDEHQNAKSFMQKWIA